MQDPSQRQTEVYIREKDFEEHIKLRKPVDDNLTTIETLQKGLYERTRDDTTNKPSNELIAANAATQATVSVMAAETAGIKTQLAPLLPLQSPAKQKEEQTELQMQIGLQHNIGSNHPEINNKCKNMYSCY